MTDREIGRWLQDGFLHISNVLSPRAINEARAEISALRESPAASLPIFYEPGAGGQKTAETVRKLRNVAPYSAAVRALALSPPLTDIAKTLLRGPAGFFGDQVLFKSARVGSMKPLHQDWAYFRIEPADAVITIWCAMNDANVKNGCMHYIPGSHKSGPRPHDKWEGTPHLVAQSDASLCAVPVRTGDCIVHHSLTLHMTPRNVSAHDRWALLLHYVRLDARFPQRSENAVAITPLP
jgi:phytanoyl-CoA hydroxylase